MVAIAGPLILDRMARNGIVRYSRIDTTTFSIDKAVPCPIPFRSCLRPRCSPNRA